MKFFLVLLSFCIHCAIAQTPTPTLIADSDIRLNTDRAKQEMWLFEIDRLLCEKVNACVGWRDSVDYPYVYIYMCCVEVNGRFDCSDDCRFGTAGIVAFFYYTYLTPNEAADKIIALKATYK